MCNCDVCVCRIEIHSQYLQNTFPEDAIVAGAVVFQPNYCVFILIFSFFLDLSLILANFDVNGSDSCKVEVKRFLLPKLETLEGEVCKICCSAK